MAVAAAAAEHNANLTGCPNDDAYLDCLRDIPAEELYNVRSQILSFAARNLLLYSCPCLLLFLCLKFNKTHRHKDHMPCRCGSTSYFCQEPGQSATSLGIRSRYMSKNDA